MNKVSSLSCLADRFTNRIVKLKGMAQSSPQFMERYSLFCISQLNNFLRAYIFSLRQGAKDSKGSVITFYSVYSSDDLLMDDLIKHGQPRIWRSGRVGQWRRNDEPAYHCPRVFVNILTGVSPSNQSVILAAMVDSWKVDALREVRNYFAHRNQITEDAAINAICSRYSVSRVRASRILMENDRGIGIKVIDDMTNYLVDFANGIV